MGDTTILFLSVYPLIVSGENNLLMLQITMMHNNNSIK